MATHQDQQSSSKSVEHQSGRGFASMDEEKQRAIASKGGQAAHEKGTAHEFDSDEAREAGKKGGEAVSQDTEHMAEIGRKGGETRAAQMQGQSSDKTTTSSSEENMDTESPQGTTRGGTPEQHVPAGRQSHKNK